jgi:hypothetical protein
MFWVILTKTRTRNIRQFICLTDVRPFAVELCTKSVYTGLFIIPSLNRYSWTAERTVTCGLQMQRNTVQICFLFVRLSAVCVCPLSHCRRQADNQFPPLATAAPHDRFMKWRRWFVFVVQAHPVVEAVESSRYPHKRTSHGVKSGDLGGQRSSAWFTATSLGRNGLWVWRLSCHE